MTQQNKTDDELVWGPLIGDAPGTSNHTTSTPQTLQAVSSSIIESATYFPDRNVLSLVFRANISERYVYYRVPAEVVEKFADALKEGRSAGRFFHRNIKGKFSFVREYNK